MRKTRIRIPPRAYRPPNDPLPRPGTISGTPDKYSSSFECRSGPASTPIAAALSARFGEEKAVAGAILYTELPARFHRPRLSEEEMDAIDSGGADYVF